MADSQIWRFIYLSMGMNQAAKDDADPRESLMDESTRKNSPDYIDIYVRVMDMLMLDAFYKMEAEKLYSDDDMIAIYKNLRRIKFFRQNGINVRQRLYINR
jgi:hypothetical protein